MDKLEDSKYTLLLSLDLLKFWLIYTLKHSMYSRTILFLFLKTLSPDKMKLVVLLDDPKEIVY